MQWGLFEDILFKMTNERNLSVLTDNNTAEMEEKVNTDTQDELVKKIIHLVEYYLSDENVLKDRFLLKHVRKSKEGFVSVKLMTSYRKVKTLTKDWQVVSHSLKYSEKLELNAEGNRVKRKTPLPEINDCIKSKSVIVYGFPFDNPTVQKVSTLFSLCGEISLVKILRPGGNVPMEVRQISSKQPEITRQICALIEFEEELSVQKALSFKEVCVISLNQTESQDKKKRKKAKSKSKSLVELETGSNSDNEKISHRSSSVSSGYSSGSSRRNSDFDNGCNPQFNNSGRCSLPYIGDYWRQRENRLNSLTKQRLFDFILRLPKGPDNTKGFHNLRRSDTSPLVTCY